MDGEAKHARFSTLNVFGKFTSAGAKPPPPPPKDKWYLQASKSALSLSTMNVVASSSQAELKVPPTPVSIASRSQTDLSRTMSPIVSTRSRSTSNTHGSPPFIPSRVPEMPTSLSKLSSSFNKRPKLFLRSNSSRTTLSQETHGSTAEDGVLVIGCPDEISRPMNVKHALHVDEGLSGLPPEWVQKLKASGVKDIDTLSMTSQRKRTTYLQNHPDLSPASLQHFPYSPSASSSSSGSGLLSPLPSNTLPKRGASLRRPVMSDDTHSDHSPTLPSQTSSSGSPPSSYRSASRPSLSASSQSHSTTYSATSPPPSEYASDEGPGTATSAVFTATRMQSRPILPHEASADDPPSTPPSRAMTFRVMNADPPSPPPAYGSPDSARAKYSLRDEKTDLGAGTVRDEGFVERRSEDTVTPEGLSTDLSHGASGQPASNSDAASPPQSPTHRTSILPPRLSLHQDIDNDLSNWSEQFFSGWDTSNSKGDKSTKRTSIKLSKPLEFKKNNSVPPLVLSPPAEESNEMSVVPARAETPSGSTTPLFNEVMSMMQPSSPTPSIAASTYPYLPSPPATSTAFPQTKLEFLNEGYNSQRNSSSNTSSRDSQSTISASSRWSRATNVRDVRDATIGHARKTSIGVASALTIPAPTTPSNAVNQTPPPSTPIPRNSVMSEDSRPFSLVSADGEPYASVDDFPMPPSPSNVSLNPGSAQASPRSPAFSTHSNRTSFESVSLPYAQESPEERNRIPSPASTRSSQSSSDSGSTSGSSQVKPLSLTSTSDECAEDDSLAEKRISTTVHVTLQYDGSETSMLSPTDSEASANKWKYSDVPPTRISITSESSDGASGGQDLNDGTVSVVDWLVDTPSPRYELHGSVKHDSVTVYSPRGETLERSSDEPMPLPGRRPSLQLDGMTALQLPNRETNKFLLPGSANKLSPQISPVSAASSSASSSSSPSPLMRYRGWVSEIVAPLEEFINHTVDPHDLFEDLQEIAEGESGSVFSASVVPRPPKPPSKDSRIAESEPEVSDGETSKLVAIKNVPLVPGGSPKLEDLRKELLLMFRVRHENVLSMDALYVDLQEDSLWIKMELMERSLADVLALVQDGLVISEVAIARFASDILKALAHLEEHGIAHRDVRSDNLLVNKEGVLKLADFSHSLLVDAACPMYSDPAGVIYWQAPEMRSGSYDARKVDVWAAGATAWEIAESEPPFMDMDPSDMPDRWPALSRATLYSSSFHNFLSICSAPSSSRPSAHDLLTTKFIHLACDRSLIVDLISQCTSIESRTQRRHSGDSQGTVS